MHLHTLFDPRKNKQQTVKKDKTDGDSRYSEEFIAKNIQQRLSRDSRSPVPDDQWKKAFEEKKKLDSLIKKSDKALFHAKSVFPFDFFPDEISIEPAQVNLVIRDFIFSEIIQSIPIKNVVDCILESSVFFSSLKFIDITFGQNTYSIRYLKKSDAYRARRIVQGLIVASKEGLDFTRIHPVELREKMERLGSVQTEEHSP